MNETSGRRRKPADTMTEFLEDRRLSGLGDGVDRVEPQAVEAIAGKPVQRVLDGKRAHDRHAIINGRSPRGLSRSKEVGRIIVQVIPFRTEVIVDDVQKHYEPAHMRGIDQGAQIVRTAIGAVRRIQQDAVIAPIAPSREVGERHQLDRRHAGLDQVIELVDDGAKAAGGGEGADMELQKYRLVPWPAAPCIVAPLVGLGVDHDAGRVDVGRVET